MGVFFIKGEIKALQETVFHVFPDANGRAPATPPAARSVRPNGNPSSWYDNFVAAIDFDNGKAKTVRLYPLDVGNTYEPSRRPTNQSASSEFLRRPGELPAVSSVQFLFLFHLEAHLGRVYPVNDQRGLCCYAACKGYEVIPKLQHSDTRQGNRDLSRNLYVALLKNNRKATLDAFIGALGQHGSSKKSSLQKLLFEWTVEWWSTGCENA